MIKSEKFIPYHDAISAKGPTATDIRIDENLKDFMDVHMKLETDAEMERRATILLKVEKIFKDWVIEVGTDILRMTNDDVSAAGGELFISGSHKLGVREPGADIDTICVAPNFCTREHFFTTLKEQLINHPDVNNFSAAEGARVPIMSFEFEGVSIDLLFARLADNIVPPKLDILDDKILIGIDEATEKSLNGPRVTQMIPELMDKSIFPNFLIVLRCIRKWAKCRGLYGNKLGYLGGINCNLLVVLVCQLYPKASPSTLLVRFFQLYSKWQWPKPVMINKIQANPPSLYGEQREVWCPEMNPFHVMPIITPAYPAMNSSASVSIHTRGIMQLEMARAHDIVKTIIQDRGSNWSRLFESSDFFLRYPHYLCCNIVGTGDDEESRSWIGFVESRIGRLPQFLESLPLKHPIHFYPVPSRTQQSPNSLCYFIGFEIDQKLAARGDKNIHIDHCAYNFQTRLNDPEKGYKGPRKEGLDFFVEHVVWKQLPKELFQVFGGREAAKIRRQEILVSQGKGKVVQVAPKDPSSEPPADVAKESSDALNGGALKAVESGSSSSSSSNGSDAAHGEIGSVIKTENVTEVKHLDAKDGQAVDQKGEENGNDVLGTDLKRKRSLSFSEGTKTEESAAYLTQMALEAALEEAEFQSLLLAQNESKEGEEETGGVLVAPQALPLPPAEALISLMPPIGRIWDRKQPKTVYRVPAVTWTMLDSK